MSDDDISESVKKAGKGRKKTSAAVAAPIPFQLYAPKKDGGGRANTVTPIPGSDSFGEFLLRNGPMDGLTVPFRAAALEAQYYWVPVKISTLYDTPVCGPEEALEVYIRTAFAILAAHEYPTPADFAGTGDATPDVDPDSDFGPQFLLALKDRTLRLSSIALGAARCATDASWAPTAAELLESESYRQSIFTVDCDGGNPWIEFTSNSKIGDCTYPEALGAKSARIEPLEMEFAWFIFQMARAAAVLNGLSLLQNGHHYLSGATYTRAFTTVERQFMQGLKPEVKEIWQGDKERFRDLMWHKACHPLSTIILSTFAMSVEVRDALIKVGLGSAAVRIPYIEPTVAGARAMLAIVHGCKVFASEAGHKISTPNLEAAMLAINSWPYAGYNAPQQVDGYNVLAQHRKEVIELVLRPAMLKAEPVVAYCIGIYKAQAEQAGNLRDTLLTANSIRRIESTNPGSVAAGGNCIRNHERNMRTQIDKGNFVPLILTD